MTVNKIVSPSEFGEHLDLLDEYRKHKEDNAKKLKDKAVGYDPYDLALNVQKNEEKFRIQVNDIRDTFFILSGKEV